MTDNAVAVRPNAGALEQVVIEGNLAKLSPEQRVQYYGQVCESVGLNPYTKPFDYIMLNGKLTLYAKRDCTDQLRKLHGVNIQITSRAKEDDIYVVTARATDASGRADESIGAVSIGKLSGDNLANALMKAETKAKRRVTLSIVGLGWLDETEVGSIPQARAVTVDASTGEIEKPEAPEAWYKDKEKLADFVRRACVYYSITSDDVRKALGNYADWDTMAAAKTAIDDYVTRQAEETVDEEAGEPVPY